MATTGVGRVGDHSSEGEAACGFEGVIWMFLFLGWSVYAAVNIWLGSIFFTMLQYYGYHGISCARCGVRLFGTPTACQVVRPFPI